jgi:hypothetical protein
MGCAKFLRRDMICVEFCAGNLFLAGMTSISVAKVLHFIPLFIVRIGLLPFDT